MDNSNLYYISCINNKVHIINIILILILIKVIYYINCIYNFKIHLY